MALRGTGLTDSELAQRLAEEEEIGWAQQKHDAELAYDLANAS